MAYKVPFIMYKAQLEQSKDVGLLIDQNVISKEVFDAVDGVRHVKAIAKKCDFDIHIVQMTLQHLIYYRVVKLLDIF